jgi:hypothetical protein
MSRKLIIIVVLTIACLAVIVSNLRFAKVTIEVVDEAGSPVVGALVKIGFGSSSKPQGLERYTKTAGQITAMSKSGDGSVGGIVTKDGYYESSFRRDYTILKYGCWRPWNEKIVVVLRPIVNPVPMYVRNFWIKIPIIGEKIGLDLAKADWVSPYGQGEYSDCILKIDKTYKNIDNFDSTLSIAFTNKYDGILEIKDSRGGSFNVGSWYRLPRTAPDQGYQNKLVKRISAGTFGYQRDMHDDNNYVFRIRSIVDRNNGSIKSMYGKIRGDIAFDVRAEKTASVHMHYYLNPDYTRNLEFDPKKNLFTNLPPNEGVALP